MCFVFLIVLLFLFDFKTVFDERRRCTKTEYVQITYYINYFYYYYSI